MSKPKLITRYRASDGKEFDSAEEAERYDQLKTATDEHEAATRRLNAALAATLKTADGKPLQLGRMFYIVRQSNSSEGVISESLYSRDIWVEQTERGLRLHRRCYGDRGHQWQSYDPTDIYASERNAKAKVLELKKERAEWLAEEIVKLEEQIGKTRE